MIAPAVLAQDSALTLVTLPGCINGLGRVKVTWNAPGLTAVRVLVGEAPDQAPLTGLEPVTGATETGYWVTDGMRFTLVEDARVIATARAVVDCDGAGNLLGGSLSALGYFPLQVGNRWVYRSNTRQVTATHFTRTVMRSEQIDGQTYYVLDNPETRLRTDAEGRIYRLTGSREELLLDPNMPPRAGAILTVTARPSQTDTPFGPFPGSVSYQAFIGALRFETGSYVRGLGLISYSANMVSGSSGGFTDGAELVEARIAGKLYFRNPAPAIYLAAEKTLLEVANRQATNCAVPCYFVACGLTPGADPPGTYKPCFESRIGVERAPAGSSIELTLHDASGVARFRVTIPAGDPSDFLAYQQVPLYSQPNQPFAAGLYRLGGRLLDGAGAELAAAALSVEVR